MITYYKKDITKEWLLNNGFRNNVNLSNEKEKIYTYTFTVYRNYGKNILKCDLNICLEDGKVKIEVYDCGTYNKYIPFYNCEYGEYDGMLENIWSKIEYTLQKLGIERVS